jgi:NAD+ kinase
MRRLRYARIGLVANVSKPDVRQLVPQLLELASQMGAKVFAEPKTRQAFKSLKIHNLPLQRLAASSDLMLSLGGDGTMLNAARLAATAGIPVLGVNLGTLGFITPVSMEAFEYSLREALLGRFKIEERGMLRAEVFRGMKKVAERLALNDVVVLRGATAKVALLETTVNGRYLASYKADGLIVATPTGSTAYSLSVGGPVLEASLPSLLIAPISPHTLSARPLVLADSSVIEIAVPDPRASMSFSTDGESGFWLKKQDRLRITRAPKPAKLLMPAEHDAWELLRTKLGWRGH